MLQEQLAQHDLQIPLELQAQTVLLEQPVLQVPLVRLELQVQWLQVRPE